MSTTTDPDPIWDDIYGEDGTAGRPMSTEQATRNETAERLRDAIVEIVSDPDHENCREAGPTNEANCIAEGLFHRGFRAIATGTEEEGKS